MQENVADLLLEAANLLLVGMSVVFVFLTILIVAVNVIAKICAHFPDPEPDNLPPRQNPSLAKTSGVSQATVAAIGAAIHQYRKSR